MKIMILSMLFSSLALATTPSPKPSPSPAIPAICGVDTSKMPPVQAAQAKGVQAKSCPKK